MKLNELGGVLLKRVLPITFGLVGFAALVVVGAWLSGMFEEKIPPGERKVAVGKFDPTTQKSYTVAEVFKDYTEEAVGTLKAASRTEISSRVMAPINRINVTAGQAVKEGDVLIELDRRALETRRSQAEAGLVSAEATLRQADSDYQRDIKLVQTRAISQAKLDETIARVEVARANLNHAKQAVEEALVMLSYATISAPKSGTIVDRLAEEGDMARPGYPLLTLYDPKSLRLEVPVMENYVVKLKKGEKLAVQIDALNDRRIMATVDEIVPEAEAASRSFLVKVSLPKSDDLFEGMFGRLIIPIEKRRHLCINTDAIDTIGQLQFVDVIGPDDVIQRRLITTGRFGDANHREVLSGLEAGERVVLKSSKDGGPEDER